MDPVKANLFIKTLIYDLDTIQFLLDYDRIKETVPIMGRILNNIESFRTDSLENGPNNIFSEEFWNGKLPTGLSLSEIRANIAKFSDIRQDPSAADLDKIDYKNFVENVFKWSDMNVSKLRYELKSPLRKRVEKRIFYSAVIIIGLSLAVILSWILITRDWGLRGDFYQGENFEKYLYSGCSKTINFSNPAEMDPMLPHDHFSARWRGILSAPKDGEYTIFVTADDGVRVFIDGNLLIADWNNHPATESFKKIFLPQGPHLITLEYFQWGYEAVLKLFWTIDGGKKEIVPARYLKH